MVEKEKINIIPKNIIPDKKDKYLVFHIQGGLGKHIAATSLLKDLSIKYSEESNRFSTCRKSSPVKPVLAVLA